MNAEAEAAEDSDEGAQLLMEAIKTVGRQYRESRRHCGSLKSVLRGNPSKFPWLHGVCARTSSKGSPVTFQRTSRRPSSLPSSPRRNTDLARC